MAYHKTHYAPIETWNTITITACGKVADSRKSNVAMTADPMRVTCRNCEKLVS